MGNNCAFHVADLILFCYERDFMLFLSDNSQADTIIIVLLKHLTLPLLEFCVCLFCYALLCAHSCFCSHLEEEEKAGCFVIIVLQM